MTSAVRSLQFRTGAARRGNLLQVSSISQNGLLLKRTVSGHCPTGMSMPSFMVVKVASSMGIGILRFTRNPETRWLCFHPWGQLKKRATEVVRNSRFHSSSQVMVDQAETAAFHRCRLDANSDLPLMGRSGQFLKLKENASLSAKK